MWTDSKIEKLKRLLDAGHTAATIAMKLGVTRNAVIGKSHRCGFHFTHDRVNGEAQYERKIKDICATNPGLTVAQVAKLVGCSEGRVYQLADRGRALPVKIKHYELTGRG